MQGDQYGGQSNQSGGQPDQYATQPDQYGQYAQPGQYAQGQYPAQPGQYAGQPAQSGTPGPYGAQPRKYSIRRANQRMAARVCRRAGLNENGVCVAYAFKSLFSACMIGVAEDVAKNIPQVGELLELVISLASFYWHRIVLVTDQNVYVFRDKPFHRPGERFTTISRGPGVVQLGSATSGGFGRFIRRGQLTFSDGTVVYHGIAWIKRAQYVFQEANIPAGY